MSIINKIFGQELGLVDAALIKKCEQCGHYDISVHPAKVITPLGLKEKQLCDQCHMYWGGD